MKKIIVTDDRGNYLCETYSTYDARLFKVAGELLSELKNVLRVKEGIGGTRGNCWETALNAVRKVDAEWNIELDSIPAVVPAPGTSNAAGTI